MNKHEYPLIRVQLLRSWRNRVVIVSYSCSILSGLLDSKKMWVMERVANLDDVLKIRNIVHPTSYILHRTSYI
jgi:hypothetical protein